MKLKVNYSPTPDEVNELDLAVATAPTGECMIGRSPDSHLVLNSPDVSRVHGKFFAHNGNYYFCDLGSRNGSVINGKLAQKNVPVQLKDKDIIRIGDYVITVEDIIPLSQQLPVTVFRTIDPTLFVGWRVNENINNINIANPAVEVNKKGLHQVNSELADAFSPAKSERETSELEPEINAQENIIETPAVADEIPASVSDLQVDLAKSFLEEVTFVQPQDLISPAPEAVSESSAEVHGVTPVIEEVTFVQPQDLNCSVVEAVSEIPADINDEDIDWDAEIPPEFTIFQPRDQLRQPAAKVDEVASDQNNDFCDIEIPSLQEFTNVQLRDQFKQPAEMVSEIPTDINDEDIDWDAEILPEFTIFQPRDQLRQPAAKIDEVASDQNNDFCDIEIPSLQEFTNVQPRDQLKQPAEMVSEIPADINDEDIDWDAEILPEFTTVQPRYVINQPQNIVIEVPPHISDEVIEDEFKVDIGGVEAPEFVDSFTPEFSHEEAIFSDEMLIESSVLFCKVPEAVSNQAADIKTDDATASTEVAVPIEDLVETSGMSELDALVSEEPEADIIPELTKITSESISQLFAEIYDAQEEYTEISEEADVSKHQEIIAQKNIVLLAHESKKSELADFVHQYHEFFSDHHTIAWASISEVLHQHAGITISQQIPAVTSGGYQTINELVNSGEISAVIFLRDYLIPQTGQANEEALLRSCNINKVLLATNLPTAEALVHYLKHLQK